MPGGNFVFLLLSNTLSVDKMWYYDITIYNVKCEGKVC